MEFGGMKGLIILASIVFCACKLVPEKNYYELSPRAVKAHEEALSYVNEAEDEGDTT